MKKKLVGFNKYTIYKIYIENQNEVIKIKDLQIFENTLSKSFSVQSNFDEKPTFDAIQILNKQGLSDKSNTFEEEKGKLKPSQKLK